MDKVKIFITEDEYIVSLDLQSRLEVMGYEIVGKATSGEETLIKLLSVEPDIILMDIILDGKMDGGEAASEIKTKYGIPLIYLTAQSNLDIFDKATKTEPYAYIIKPYTERELLVSISIALEKSKFENELIANQKKLEELNKHLDDLVLSRTRELELKNKSLQQEISQRIIAQERELRLKKIIEQTQEHIFITRVDGKVDYANPALIDNLGYAKDEIIGQKIVFFIHDERSSIFKSKLSTAIKLNRPFLHEVFNKKKDGGYLVMETIIIPLMDNKNRISHIAYVGRDVTRKKEIDKIIIDAEESERGRISRELHDGIGQSITAMKLSVGYLLKNQKLDSNSVSVLNELRELISDTTSEIRQISFNLKPSILIDYGLVPALLKTIESIGDKSNMVIRLHYDDKGVRFNKSIETSLFRIVQESVNNAIRYSGAKRMDIYLTYNQTRVMLRINDDGKGFDKSKLGLMDHGTSGQGIINMRHRASALNGNFEIKSHPNKGTEIIVNIPIISNEN